MIDHQMRAPLPVLRRARGPALPPGPPSTGRADAVASPAVAAALRRRGRRPGSTTLALALGVLALAPLGLGACDNAEPPGDDADVFATGSAPNGVVATTCAGATTLLVPASQGGALDLFRSDGPRPAVNLGAGSTPWAVALRGDTGEDGAVVTGFGDHSLFLVDPCAGTVVDAARVDTLPQRVGVDGARLRHDVAGVGAAGDVVTEMPLMAPEAVVVDDGGGVWVTFTNLLEFADTGGPMEAGAGVLARFVVDDSDDGPRLVYERHVELRCQNPQGLALGATGSGAVVVVTCTGLFENDGGLRARTPGGIAVYDTDFVELAHREDDASYGTPVVVVVDNDGGGPAPGEARVVVGDVFGALVSSFALDDLAPRESQPLGDDDESIFKVLLVNGEVAALRFLTGDLVFDPFRTQRTRAIGDPRQPPRGLIDFAVGEEGDGWAVFSLSSELVKVPLE